jgi:hypothetical protein
MLDTLHIIDKASIIKYLSNIKYIIYFDEKLAKNYKIL